MDTIATVGSALYFIQSFLRFKALFAGLIQGNIHKNCILGIFEQMKHAFPLKIEILLMVILIPPTLIVINYLMLGEMYFSSFKNFGIATSVTLAILSCVWVVQAAIGKRMIELFPSHHDTLKRVMIFTTINLLIVGLFVTFTCWFYDIFNILNFEFNRLRWKWCLVGGAISCIINQAVYETVASYERIKASQLEAEQLKKAQLQTQFESLKEQVNPHFLFNSLNSLSSLIATNPDMAEEFVEEMSRVYRYLLRSNEEQLTTLRKELEFIESYTLLLKTRFGSGFQPVITVEEKMKEYLLPPMTLQLLIENAVKHNIVDPDIPLTVQLYTEGEKLVVSNNLQKKNKAVVSNKVGLSNIISKYKLLNCPDVEIQETADEFSVVLPLIKNMH